MYFFLIKDNRYYIFYSGIWSFYLMSLISLRVVKAVEAGNCVRNSLSQRALGMAMTGT